MPRQTAVASALSPSVVVDHAPVVSAQVSVPQPDRSWNGVSWVMSSAALALLPIVVLHVTGAALVHPLLDPISYYALIPGGYPLVLLGCSLLGGAGICLAFWLGRSGLPGVRLPVGLLISFAVAFVLVGIFPTDPLHADVVSTSATIHRIGAAWGVVVVPITGVLVGRSLAAGALSAYPRRMIRLARAVACVMALFFAIHLPLALLGSRIPAFGFLERAGFALVIGYLILMAITVRVERGRPALPLAVRSSEGAVRSEPLPQVQAA